jgi:outer membrane protein OmpA-like peptidoglycan-associated protein
MALLIWAVCLLAAVSQLQRGPTEQITLLPNQDGKPSAVIITTAGKDTVLDKPFQTAAVDSRGAVATISDSAQIKSRYDALIDTLPQRAAVFIVYFITDTDNLTPESAAQLAQIKQQLASRPAPEIIVIGHTDTVAKREYNDALSMRRAETVKRILVEAGIAADQIAVQARGERELLIQTADGVDEPRNRRVEIRVR